MFAKHSTFFVACLLLFEATVLVVSKSDLCETLKPCGKRGECVLTGDVKSKDIFATKCSCLLNYSGTWCQFVGKNNYHVNHFMQVKDISLFFYFIFQQNASFGFDINNS